MVILIHVGLFVVFLGRAVPKCPVKKDLSAQLGFNPLHRHSGIVVYGNEYYFGGGIQHSLSGNTPSGTPIRVIDLGVTYVPKDVFETYLIGISPRYTAETYSLLGHNCNNFSNEVAQFLVGLTIPDYILQLPNEVTRSPIGSLVRRDNISTMYRSLLTLLIFFIVVIFLLAVPMILNLETMLKSGAVPKVPGYSPCSLKTKTQQRIQHCCL